MNIIFRIWMWWNLKYGLLPKLAKDLKKKGEHKKADVILAEIEKMKKLRSFNEMRDASQEHTAQTIRDLRIQGRHADADGLDAINEHIKKNGLSFPNDDRPSKNKKS